MAQATAKDGVYSEDKEKSWLSDFGLGPRSEAETFAANVTLATGFLAQVAGLDQGIASMTANNAVTNNFLKHDEAASMKKAVQKCEGKSSGCSDSEMKAILDQYRGVSNSNIAKVDSCIKQGDAACVEKLLRQAANRSEVTGILPLGYGADEDIFVRRQDNVTIYGSTKGSASPSGTDVDQALQVQAFRQSNCAGISRSDCDRKVSEVLDNQIYKAGLLALGGAGAGLAGRGLSRGSPQTGAGKLSTANVAREAEGFPAVTTAQRQTEVANLFDAGNPQNGVTIGNRSLLPRANENVPIFDGASKAEVEEFFTRLAGVSKLPEPIPITIKGTGGMPDRVGVRYTVTNASGNSFTLRDIAKSTDQSGPVWTVEVPKEIIPGAKTSGKTVEIKFTR